MWCPCILRYPGEYERDKYGEIIYEERRKVLEGENFKEHIFEIIEDCIERLILLYINPDAREEDRDEEAFFGYLRKKTLIDFDGLKSKGFSPEDLKDEIVRSLGTSYEAKAEHVGGDLFHFMQKSILLQIIDSKWKEHLHNLDSLRQNVSTLPLFSAERSQYNIGC